jgi:hypothetical protein
MLIPFWLLVVLVLGLSIVFRNHKAKDLGGSKIISYGPGLRMFGCVMLIAGLAVLIFPTLDAPAGKRLPGLIMGPIFFCLFLSFFLELNFVMVSFNDQFAEFRSPWRRRRRVPWTSMEGLTYSAKDHAFILRLNDGSKPVRISRYLSGLESFAEELDRRSLLAKGR